MTGHLCLKWNNHSSAFLRSIGTIQKKERYCDATIACQGKYFPVHRIILSTCSEYFDEIFERMQCQHPYIVFKDIEPREMELLLNYMYQGEVNVLQEMLPSLIKAAEALQIKGLAVPDDLPLTKDSSSSKKRSSSNTDHPQPKKRLEERKRRNSSEFIIQPKNSDSQKFQNTDTASNMLNNLRSFTSFDHLVEDSEPNIKEEPPESVDFATTSSDLPVESTTSVGIPPYFSSNDDSSNCLKEETSASTQEIFENQGAAWNNFTSEDTVQSMPPEDTPPEEDIGLANEREISWPNSSEAYKLTTPSVGDERTASHRKSSDVNKLIFSCPACSYKSDRKYNIKLHHMSKHSEEKAFQCEICSARFKLRHGLLAHIRRHKESVLQGLYKKVI